MRRSDKRWGTDQHWRPHGSPLRNTDLEMAKTELIGNKNKEILSSAFYMHIQHIFDTTFVPSLLVCRSKVKACQQVYRNDSFEDDAWGPESAVNYTRSLWVREWKFRIISSCINTKYRHTKIQAHHSNTSEVGCQLFSLLYTSLKSFHSPFSGYLSLSKFCSNMMPPSQISLFC